MKISLNLTNNYFKTNNLLIDWEKGVGSPYFLDYSGFKLKVLKHDLITLKPVKVVAGGRFEEIRYDKTNFKNLDSLELMIDYDNGSSYITEKLYVDKDKTVRYNYQFYSFKNKANMERREEFALTQEKYNQFLQKLSESSIYEIPENNSYRKGSFSCQFSLWLKGKFFKNYGRLFSRNLSDFLFKELVPPQMRPTL